MTACLIFNIFSHSDFWLMFETIIIICACVYVSMLIFLIEGFARISPQRTPSRPTVSVVLAARNEERNLPVCLDALRSQNYPSELLQIVLVNDRSTDRTGEILQQFLTTYPNAEMVQIQEPRHAASPKKQALANGITRASGELIFTTDADCRPPPNWIAETVSLFDAKVGVVIGAAPLESRKSLLGGLLSLESMANAFVAAAVTGWNLGVTCTGRNLAYRKSVFEEVHGFEAIKHSLSGDDDLFLQQVRKQTKWKIAACLDHRTAVFSPAPQSFRRFVQQRRRHVSAGKYYSRPIQLSYLLFNLANAFLFAGLAYSMFASTDLVLFGSLFGIKVLLDFCALALITVKLRKQAMLLYFPLWELFFIFVQIFVAPLAFVGKIKWK